MKISWSRFHNITTCIFALIIISTSANAGSFRDFILDDGLSDSSRFSAQVPANSKSAACMQCHDGSKAKSIGIKHADTVMTFTSHGSSNHPVMLEKVLLLILHLPDWIPELNWKMVR